MSVQSGNIYSSLSFAATLRGQERSLLFETGVFNWKLLFSHVSIYLHARAFKKRQLLFSFWRSKPYGQRWKRGPDTETTLPRTSRVADPTPALRPRLAREGAE